MSFQQLIESALASGLDSAQVRSIPSCKPSDDQPSLSEQWFEYASRLIEKRLAANDDLAVLHEQLWGTYLTNKCQLAKLTSERHG